MNQPLIDASQPLFSPAPSTRIASGGKQAATLAARWAPKLLSGAAASWFAVAVAGQLIFVAYIIAFYGGVALAGNPEEWNKVLPHGWESGNTLGNLLVSTHLLFAVLIIVGGALQLTPAVRRRWPRFHRMNGRIYMLSALIMSLGGLVMLWTRNAVGDLPQHLALSFNAVLILLCASMALRFALVRDIARHRPWAIRLFLVVSGVWFFRVGLMFWVIANQGPVGFDPATFTGPALNAIGLGQTLVPLAIAELYFRAKRSATPMPKLLTAGVLGLCVLLTAGGVAAASMAMWLPRL